MSHGKHQSPVALVREGEHFHNVYRISDGDAVFDVHAHTFDSASHIDGVIRIVREEYSEIDTSLPYFTHFNLEFGGHKIGARYALPKIIERGYYRSSDDEVPPTLSFNKALVGVCVRVCEHVPYQAFRPEDFRYSMKHIQNVEQLKKAIIARYSVSMPDLSEKEILLRGVAMTILRIDGALQGE